MRQQERRGEIRNEKLVLRCTPAEKAEIERTSNKRGVSLSRYLIELFHEKQRIKA